MRVTGFADSSLENPTMPKDSGRAKFDPRFDPRYQPGYTGAAEDAAVSAPVTPTAGSPETAPKSHAVESSLEDGDSSESEVESDEAAALPDPNSFEKTLAATGLILVVGGVAVSMWANSFNYSRSPFGGPLTLLELLQTSGWTLSAPMVTTGLAILVGLIFRRALTWKPGE